MTGVPMGLTPNRQVILDLLGYVPILVLGVALADALHWIWQWKRGLLTPVERRKRLRRYAVLFAAGVGVLAISQIIRDVLANSLGWHTAGLPVVLLASILMLLLHPAYRKPTEKDVERHFGQNPRHCGQCDYDLTGNVSGVCPECGWLIPAAPVRVEDPNWWCWWRKWDIEYLERWRTTCLLHMLMVLSSFGLAAVIMFSYTLLKPILIIDPRTGLMMFHRPWFVYILPVAALAMVVVGLQMAVNAVRVVVYGLRKKRMVDESDRGS
jgi:hypothetical protein